MKDINKDVVALGRPLKILPVGQVNYVCDSPSGARTLARELQLSPGLVSTVKGECNDPVKRALRTGASLEGALQAITDAPLPPTIALTIPQNPIVNSTMNNVSAGRECYKAKRKLGAANVTEKSAIKPDEDYGDDDGADDEDEDYDFSDSYSPTGFGGYAQDFDFSDSYSPLGLNGYYAQNFGFLNPQPQPYTFQPPGSRIARLPDVLLRMAENHFVNKAITDFERTLSPIWTPTTAFTGTMDTASSNQHSKQDDELALALKEPQERADSAGKAWKTAEPELDQDDGPIEETGSCSCLSDKDRSQDASYQKSAVNVEDVSVESPHGTLHVDNSALHKPPLEEAISDPSSVGNSVTLPAPPAEEPKEENTQQYASGNANQASAQKSSTDQSTGVGARASPAPLAEKPMQEQNTQQSTLVNVNPPPPPAASESTSLGTSTPSGTGTIPLTGGTQERPKITEEKTKQDQASSTENQENKSPENQQVVDVNPTISHQPPVVAPVTFVGVDIQPVPTLLTTDTKPSANTLMGPLSPPPPMLKDEDQKSNGAPTNQSNMQFIQRGGDKVAPAKHELPVFKPENNFTKLLLTTLVVIAGVGIALYVFNPAIQQWVFSHYVRIFRKASPQYTSAGTFTQPQQNSGYARTNKPDDVAFF